MQERVISEVLKMASKDNLLNEKEVQNTGSDSAVVPLALQLNKYVVFFANLEFKKVTTCICMYRLNCHLMWCKVNVGIALACLCTKLQAAL